MMRSYVLKARGEFVCNKRATLGTISHHNRCLDCKSRGFGSCMLTKGTLSEAEVGE